MRTNWLLVGFVLIGQMVSSSVVVGQVHVDDVRAGQQAEYEMTCLRCRHYQAARLAWVDAVCRLSDAQRGEIKRLSDELLAKVCDELERELVSPDRPFDMGFDYMVLVFGGSRYGAGKLQGAEFEQALEGVLNKDQLVAYRGAMERRAERLHEGFVEEVINVIDGELYLTDAQREIVRGELSRMKVFDHARYSLDAYPMNGYVKMGDEFDGMISRLDPVQVARWRFLKKVPLSVHPLEGLEGDDCLEVLGERAEAQRVLYHDELKVRVNYLAASKGLGREGRRRLELAAEGMSQRNFVTWQKQMRQKLELKDSMTLAWQLSTDWPTLFELGRDPLWSSVSSQYRLEEIWEGRKRTQKQASRAFVLAVLDQELWLTEGKRRDVDECLKRSFEQIEVPDRGSRYRGCFDLLLMARFLVDESSENVSSVLGDEQKVVYRQLRGMFRPMGTAIYWDTRFFKEFRLGFVSERAFLEEIGL